MEYIYFNYHKNLMIQHAGTTNRHVTIMLDRNNDNQALLGNQTSNGTMTTTNYYHSTSTVYLIPLLMVIPGMFKQDLKLEILLISCNL